ncbi:MAG: isoprenylcysteine carboxylmethyltransferase family protein [Sphingomonadales bacterium]|nr:isoprenylcysteine carboxylmethyltransferase family protein [Sphingomonadales bacterium]
MLDRVEQVLIVLLWMWLVRRVVVSNNPYAPLLLLSETAVMVFVLIRRPTQAISMALGDWLLAITATAAPLLVQPGVNLLPQMLPVALGLLFVGNCGQLYAKLALRRSFGVAPANRGIKVSGPYRLVRHPMYAGYLIVHIGSLLLFFTPINLAIYVIGWWAQIRRLLAEEALLSQDSGYRDYQATVRWRLVPGIF